MKPRHHLLLLFLACLILIPGCEKKPVNRVITGSVFIVTKGRENVKLGLVAVDFFDLQLFQKHQASAYAYAQSNWNVLHAKETDMDAEERTKHLSFMDAREAYSTAEDNHSLWNNRVTLRILSQKQAEFHARQKDYEEFRETHAKVKALLEAWNSKYVNAVLSGISFPAIASAKTDADGRFSVEVPPDRPIVAIASSSRKLIESEEKYIWIVRVPEIEAKSVHSQPLLLSNDNLFDPDVGSTLFPVLGSQNQNP